MSKVMQSSFDHRRHLGTPCSSQGKSSFLRASPFFIDFLKLRKFIQVLESPDILVLQTRTSFRLHWIRGPAKVQKVVIFIVFHISAIRQYSSLIRHSASALNKNSHSPGTIQNGVLWEKVYHKDSKENIKGKFSID